MAEAQKKRRQVREIIFKVTSSDVKWLKRVGKSLEETLDNATEYAAESSGTSVYITYPGNLLDSPYPKVNAKG